MRFAVIVCVALVLLVTYVKCNNPDEFLNERDLRDVNGEEMEGTTEAGSSVSGLRVDYVTFLCVCATALLFR